MTKTEKKFYDMDTCRKVSHSVMMFDSSWGSLVAGDGRDGGGGGDEVNLELVRWNTAETGGA